jgi:hypothetical protein
MRHATSKVGAHAYTYATVVAKADRSLYLYIKLLRNLAFNFHSLAVGGSKFQ